MNDKAKTNERPIRCAIYTRKSSEEGLEQEFNSLDAQREAAEAYISSQCHDRWVALSDRYDDGGFPGGTMRRPALEKLLADIRAGQVDCVVVYKVDRLSRSLLDFARMMVVHPLEGAVTGGDRVITSRFDVDVIWRVRVDQMNGLAIEHSINIFLLAAIATEQSMVAENPQIASLGDRFIGRLRHIVRIALAFSHVWIEELGQLVFGEPEQIQVKIHCLKLGQFDRQPILTPIGDWPPPEERESDSIFGRGDSGPRGGVGSVDSIFFGVFETNRDSAG